MNSSVKYHDVWGTVEELLLVPRTDDYDATYSL
jgi:hypothetical protein